MKRTQVFEGDSAQALARSIEQAIRSGRVGPGDRLPPIRDLGAQLRLSPVTVASAYRLLTTRGLTSGAGRRGTHVATTAVLRPPMPRARAIPDAVDLSHGEADPLLLPPLDGALAAVPRHLAGHREPTLGALVAFAAGELEADGVPAASVTVVSGAQDGLERVLREHLRLGDRIAVEDPTSPGVLDLISASGFVSEPVSIDSEGPVPDAVDRALRKNVRAIIVSARAHDPTGAALTRPRSHELRRVLRAHPDVLVVELDLVGSVSGMPLASLCHASHRRWAAIRSTSKFLGPDLRVGILAGDSLTVSRVTARYAVGAGWVSHLLQRLALSLWSDPANGRRLARAAEVYAQRRDALVAALAQRGIQITARSGFNVWLPVREETATVLALAESGWMVAAGERFRVRSQPGIRVTTSALSTEHAVGFAADFAKATRLAGEST